LAFLLFFIFWFGIEGSAQVERPVRSPRSGLTPARVMPNLPAADTARNGRADSLNQTKTDSLRRQPQKSDIETTIAYSARDSINSSLDRKVVKLYGAAKVTYGQIELEAEEIIIDYNTSTLSANGRLDSAGRRIGFPIFKNGSEKYETKDMVYNFKNRKARISEVVTQQGDGFLHGDAVFKNEKNEMYAFTNAYTTCNLAHPHFRIISRKSKAIPGDKIVSGPFYMEFNDVPTPLGFAFGIFPSPKKSASGIIVPSYGEERLRGFFLRGGGYFFDISDYIKLTVTADLFSRGSSALNLNSIYKKRYAYSGNFAFNFTNNRLSPNIELTDRLRDFRVTWSHSPQTRGTGRFSASVNAATANFNQNNFLGLNTNPNAPRLDQVTRRLASNISYAKNFTAVPVSLGVNLRINQDLRTRQVDLPLPDINMNLNNIYPFKQAKTEFLQNIAFRVTGTATNQITNNLGRIIRTAEGEVAPRDSIAAFNLQNMPAFFRNARQGARWNLPIATSFRVLRHLQVSPSFNYDEIWYRNRLQWGADSARTRAIVTDTIQGFNRIANYSGGVSLTTRLFGMFVSRNPNARIKAVRHVVNPTVSWNYQPDFTQPRFGYFERVPLANGRQELRSVHEGFVYGTSRSGVSNALGFSINNTIEMKVMGKKDTVARKIPIFNTLSLSSSYNLAADSFRLAPIAMAANTNILNDKINVNLNATIDPYQYVLSVPFTQTAVIQRRIDRYAWEDGISLGQITAANFAFSTNLNPAGQKSDNNTREKIARSNLRDAEKNMLLRNSDNYIDFEVPWNLRINFNLDYARVGYQPARVTKTVRLSGDVSLTQKWKVVFNSGYDFQTSQFTMTTLGINRDLHCWQMSVNWTPFGRFTSYTFTIGIKSGMLRDLKLDRNRHFLDTL
jgi:lipopolysaccharide export system protein LptA